MVLRFSMKYCYSIVALTVAIGIIFLFLSHICCAPGNRNQEYQHLIRKGEYYLLKEWSTTEPATSESVAVKAAQHQYNTSPRPTYSTANPTEHEPMEQCKKRVHVEYLSKRELKDWLKESARGCEYAHCQFMNGTNRFTVPLMSFPGSGNTWVRGLLEKATGICTGSVFHDKKLSWRGLVGEGIISGAVIAVKMHGFSTRLKGKVIDSLLLIMRSPYDTLVAEWTRRKSGRNHTGTVSHAHFNTREWNIYIRRGSHHWMNVASLAFNRSKTDNFKIHVIRYEELKADKVEAIEKVLQFLGFKYDREDLAARLKDDYETFKRDHSKSHGYQYTRAQKAVVNNKITELIQFVKKEHFVGELNFLSEYIQR